MIEMEGIGLAAEHAGQGIKAWACARVLQQGVDLWRARLHHHDELGPRQRLEAVQVEGVCQKQLYASAAGCWRQLRRYGMQRVPGGRRQHVFA